MAFARFGEEIEPMLVDGVVGLVWAPQGQLSRVLQFTISAEELPGSRLLWILNSSQDSTWEFFRNNNDG